MKELYLKGHINYNNELYTFLYQNKSLTLIPTKNKQEFDLFGLIEHIEYIEGMTLDGLNIVFYVNDDVKFKNGACVCFPKIIFLVREKGTKFFELEYDAIAISGGILNDFYDNFKIIKIGEKGEIFFKKCEETVTEEEVEINSHKSVFEFSVKEPGKREKGDNVEITGYNSLMRVKYNNSQNHNEVYNDILDIDKFFKSCACKIKISFDTIFLEKLSESGRYENIVEIFIPYMNECSECKEVGKKKCFEYEVFKGKLNNVFKNISSLNYLISILPDDKPNPTVNNSEYCSAFSCFESVHEYRNSLFGEVPSEIFSEEEKRLEEIKQEIIVQLDILDEKYKGKDGKKRKLIQHISNIIEGANLRLEKSISVIFNNNKYVLDTIYYKIKEILEKEGMEKSIEKAVKDRDLITHSKIVKLDDISTGIYEILFRLNYIMIFEIIGIEKDNIESAMKQVCIKDKLL